MRWAAPAWPFDQDGGDQAVVAAVRGRDDTVVEEVVNVAVSSWAMPAIWTDVAPLFEPVARNWIHASVIVAPVGTARLSNRMPIVCAVVPARGMLRDDPSQSAKPVGRCSTSSKAFATGVSSGSGAPTGTTVTVTSSVPVSAPSSAVARRT